MSDASAAIYTPGQAIPGTDLRVVRKVGEGGMGSVYEVEQVHLRVHYMVKIIHPKLLKSKRRAERMEQEARLMADLQHDNIVRVYWAGWTQDDPRLFYYAMDKLEGFNLRRMLTNCLRARVRPELASVLNFETSLLRALGYAHRKGAIHRDVKPENIFLHRTWEGHWAVKLLDFGVAAVLSRKKRTTAHMFRGTYRYAAPEQLMGEKPGPGIDVYSSGLVFYEMLAGRGPFDHLVDDMAIAQAHIHRAPPPISRFRKIHPPLEELVLSMLEKDPARRPRDCFELARTVERVRIGIASEEQSESTGVSLDELARLSTLSGAAAKSESLDSDHEFEDSEEEDAEESRPNRGEAGTAPRETEGRSLGLAGADDSLSLPTGLRGIEPVAISSAHDSTRTTATSPPSISETVQPSGGRFVWGQRVLTRVGALGRGSHPDQAGPLEDQSARATSERTAVLSVGEQQRLEKAHPLMDVSSELPDPSAAPALEPAETRTADTTGVAMPTDPEPEGPSPAPSRWRRVALPVGLFASAAAALALWGARNHQSSAEPSPTTEIVGAASAVGVTPMNQGTELTGLPAAGIASAGTAAEPSAAEPTELQRQEPFPIQGTTARSDQADNAPSWGQPSEHAGVVPDPAPSPAPASRRGAVPVRKAAESKPSASALASSRPAPIGLDLAEDLPPPPKRRTHIVSTGR